MSYNFRMVFSGLCAFVPNDEANPDSAKVLLVNTRHENIQEVLPDLEEHYPVLRFNLADVQGNQGSLGEGFGVWSLELEDIKMERRKRKKNGDEGTVLPQSFTVQNGGQDNDFSNVPRVRDFLRGVGNIDPDCLRPDPLFDLATARINLDQGTLQVDEFAKFRNKHVKVQFVPPMTRTAYRKRPLPHRVALQVTAEDDEEIVLRSRRFGKVGHFREVVLGSSDGQDVEVRVINLCCGYFLEEENGRGDLPEADEDFGGFYVLSENFLELVRRNKKLPVPVPIEFNVVQTREGSLAAGGDTIKCSVATYFSAKATVSPVLAIDRGGSVLGDDPPDKPLDIPGVRNILEDFQIESQRPRKNLCWAAATVSVHQFLGGTDWLDQCRLACKLHLGKDRCLPARVKEWDQPFALVQALDFVGNLFKPIGEPLDFGQVVVEIDAGYPIVCLVEEGVGIGHAMVVVGYQNLGGQEMVYVADPRIGRMRFFEYERFKEHGNLRWTESFLTKKVEERKWPSTTR